MTEILEDMMQAELWLCGRWAKEWAKASADKQGFRLPHAPKAADRFAALYLAHKALLALTGGAHG